MLHRRHQDEEKPVEVTTSSGTPALFFGTAIGGAAILLGFYTLIRAGLNTHDLSRPAVTVLNIEHTPLLALSEVSFGVVMILAAMTPRLGRIIIGVLSATLVAFGAALLSAAPTSRLHHWFGVTHHQGLSLVIVGTIGLLATLAFPTITRRTIVRSAPAAAAMTSLPDVDLSAPVPLSVSPIADAASSVDTTDTTRSRVDLQAPIADHLQLCLSACDSMFDAADAAEGDIRFCGLGHAQCWNGSTWEIVPTDTDHEGLHTRAGASR